MTRASNARLLRRAAKAHHRKRNLIVPRRSGLYSPLKSPLYPQGGGGGAAAQISAVVYDGDYLKHTGGPAGAADGPALTVVWAGKFNSDGSTMYLRDIPGTVPARLIRQSDNTILFEGGTAGAVFSNVTTAVAASLGDLIILASCNGTSSVLKVVHSGGTITGTNTPGAASDLDLTADWFYGADGGAASFLDAIQYMAWDDDIFIDFDVANNIEQFWDTTNNRLRDPGADGSNPLDGDHEPLVCHVNPAASHATNIAAGGDADDGSTFEDGPSPGAYSPDFVPPPVPVTLALTDNAVSNINAAASTFSAMSLGAADDSRVLLCCVVARANLAVPGAAPTVTLDGDTMTEIVTGMFSNGNLRARAHIYAIAQSAMTNPTATSADVVVTYGGQHFGKGLAVYRMTGASATATDSAADEDNSDPLSATITFPDGGAVLATAFARSSTTGFTWTNVTEDMAQTVGGSNSGAHESASDAGVSAGSTAVDADHDATNDRVMVVASFAKAA